MSAALDFGDLEHLDFGPVVLAPERRVGVALDKVVAARKRWQREQRRPPALTAREALAALQFEARFVWVAAGNVRQGVELTEEDFVRLTLAVRSIDLICDEVGI